MVVYREELDALRQENEGLEQLPPIHPGEVLLEEFLEPMGITPTKLARELDVPSNRITRIVYGHSSISAETAALLSAVLGTTPEFWLNLQASYDLSCVSRKSGFQGRIDELKNQYVKKHAIVKREAAGGEIKRGIVHKVKGGSDTGSEKPVKYYRA